MPILSATADRIGIQSYGKKMAGAVVPRIAGGGAA
jgi:hypothetical protein